MRVNIDEIKEGGLSRVWDYSPGAIDEMVAGDRAGYRARGVLRVDGRLEKVERRVLFRAHGEAELTVPCGRCLVPVDVQVPFDFDLTYVPADEAEELLEPQHEEHGGGKGEASFGLDSVDEETYSGKVIDLDPAVREQFLLALPAYPVCKEGCKGLCTVCGGNRNERECGCDRHVVDPRWAALEKLKQRR